MWLFLLQTGVQMALTDHLHQNRLPLDADKNTTELPCHHGATSPAGEADTSLSTDLIRAVGRDSEAGGWEVGQRCAKVGESFILSQPSPNPFLFQPSFLSPIRRSTDLGSMSDSCVTIGLKLQRRKRWSSYHSPLLALTGKRAGVN